MQAVLMAGGEGARLRPFTHVLPKPLVPIGEISILERVLQQLSHCNFDNVIISVGYKAEIIMAVLGNGSRFNMDIRYHLENKPLGTIGALASIEGLENDFLVMNGDICTNLNFRRFYETHIAQAAEATVGIYARQERIELGVLELDSQKKHIITFQEKPIYNFLVSMGVNAFNKAIVGIIPKDQYFGFDTLMQKMLKDGVKIHSYLFSGYWVDIGRPDDYDRLMIELEKNPNFFSPQSE